MRIHNQLFVSLMVAMSDTVGLPRDIPNKHNQVNSNVMGDISGSRATTPPILLLWWWSNSITSHTKSIIKQLRSDRCRRSISGRLVFKIVHRLNSPASFILKTPFLKDFARDSLVAEAMTSIPFLEMPLLIGLERIVIRYQIMPQFICVNLHLDGGALFV